MRISLSAHAKDVMENRNIEEKWVYNVLSSPSSTFSVDSNEIHFYGNVGEYGNRCLKVVINPIKKLVITAYFDRRMTKKGCK